MAATPESNVHDVLEEMRGMPRKDVNATLAVMAEWQGIPSWARNLADEPALFERYVDGLAGLHTVLLAPYESRLTALSTRTAPFTCAS